MMQSSAAHKYMGVPMLSPTGHRYQSGGGGGASGSMPPVSPDVQPDPRKVELVAAAVHALQAEHDKPLLAKTFAVWTQDPNMLLAMFQVQKNGPDNQPAESSGSGHVIATKTNKKVDEDQQEGRAKVGDKRHATAVADFGHSWVCKRTRPCLDKFVHMINSDNLSSNRRDALTKAFSRENIHNVMQLSAFMEKQPGVSLVEVAVANDVQLTSASVKNQKAVSASDRAQIVLDILRACGFDI